MSALEDGYAIKATREEIEHFTRAKDQMHEMITQYIQTMIKKLSKSIPDVVEVEPNQISIVNGWTAGLLWSFSEMVASAECTPTPDHMTEEQQSERVHLRAAEISKFLYNIYAPALDDRLRRARASHKERGHGG